MADMQADMGTQAGLSGGQMQQSYHEAQARAVGAAMEAKNAYDAQAQAMYGSIGSSSQSLAGSIQPLPRKLSEVVEHGYNQACKIAEEADRLANLLAGAGNDAKASAQQTASPTLVERAGHIGLVLSRIERSLARISAAL